MGLLRLVIGAGSAVLSVATFAWLWFLLVAIYGEWGLLGAAIAIIASPIAVVVVPLYLGFTYSAWSFTLYGFGLVLGALAILGLYFLVHIGRGGSLMFKHAGDR